MSYKRRSNEDWLEIIRECKSSGLSDLQWLKENGIAPSSYYKKLGELCGNAEAKSELPAKKLPEIRESHEIVEVSFGNESDSLHTGMETAPAMVLKTAGYTLEINNSAGAMAIRNVLEALRQIC